MAERIVSCPKCGQVARYVNGHILCAACEDADIPVGVAIEPEIESTGHTFGCPHCGKVLRAPDKMRGKRGRCPQCKAVYEVPNVEAPGRVAPTAAPTAATIHVAARPSPSAAKRTIAKPIVVLAIVGCVSAVVVLLGVLFFAFVLQSSPLHLSDEDRIQRIVEHEKLAEHEAKLKDEAINRIFKQKWKDENKRRAEFFRKQGKPLPDDLREAMELDKQLEHPR